MNKCFLIGKVISEPIFDFFFMKNDISICYFTITLTENNKVDVFALNDIADFVYQNVSLNQLIMIDGTLNSTKSGQISVMINNIDFFDDLLKS